MMGGYVGADPTEIPNVTCMKFPSTVTVFGVGLRVNGDADFCVETLQTILVKQPWIDSVASGGKPPYAFQQDSPPSHKALKTQDWMDGRESSSCHTKLMVIP
ncbi:hypothetical protein ACTXT7_013087 [Hymenolepis weldensis]